jgi:hypothetical protein
MRQYTRGVRGCSYATVSKSECRMWDCGRRLQRRRQQEEERSGALPKQREEGVKGEVMKRTGRMVQNRLIVRGVERRCESGDALRAVCVRPYSSSYITESCSVSFHFPVARVVEVGSAALQRLVMSHSGRFLENWTVGLSNLDTPRRVPDTARSLFWFYFAIRNSLKCRIFSAIWLYVRVGTPGVRA